MGVFIMTITWYNNTDDKKKINKLPALISAGTCNIFGTCNMDNPAFIVDSVLGNYVEFDNTFYFVDSKSYVNGKWVIHCSVDCLYTNRNEINNLKAMCVRSESRYNKYLVDNMLPVQAYRTAESYPVGNEVISNTETTYIVGVI